MKTGKWGVALIGLVLAPGCDHLMDMGRIPWPEMNDAGTPPPPVACPGDPNGIVCDVYASVTCPPGSNETVIDCRPQCQDPLTCAEVPPANEPHCLGDPNGVICTSYPDVTCPPGSNETVIDCRPQCQDPVTCDEVPSVCQNQGSFFAVGCAGPGNEGCRD